jgi:shikimate kinase
MPAENIVLVGPMGAGKSTIGLLLSKTLNIPFLDIDHEIEARAGADIPWIFEKEGEAGFRKRESNLLFELSQRKGVVLATGGGAVEAEHNRTLLKSAGIVVYLAASIDQQLTRTAKDKHRPLLQTTNPREVLTNLMKKREPFYKEVAQITITTDRRSPRLVVKEILQKAEQCGFISPISGAAS